ncbi:DUF2997 domain-containing protein [Paenibacillus paeoniae]|uniref:DUF2997 domain-containing protein n=1 Tax=Paenibacillus paeoniae TaxID=2292705 RepID=A0A371PE35_9BACL|nr:DUF2997 domain-containing protein [Paenibacillus paeoniae]REK74203.1 DUF2997 domain-containing protein [Paenibacillus paeoniae]
MSKKQIRVQIFADGQISAEVIGVKGKACMDYIELLEQLLDADAIDSTYTSEYYETEQTVLQHRHINTIKNN